MWGVVRCKVWFFRYIIFVFISNARPVTQNASQYGFLKNMQMAFLVKMNNNTRVHANSCNANAFTLFYKSTFVLNQVEMLTEKQKMLRGELYHASDAELLQERQQARRLLKKLNDASYDEPDLRQVLKQLIPQQGTHLWIEPPFFCDYGSNITVGDNVYFNFNCTILDVMPVTIGSQVLIGPAVQIYTALHPMQWQERASGLEYAKPVVIGSHVWIGGGAIICPGVSIGHRSIIGAGSIVTRDIPDDVFAAGNPCRVVKPLK